MSLDILEVSESLFERLKGNKDNTEWHCIVRHLIGAKKTNVVRNLIKHNMLFAEDTKYEI